MVFKIKSVSALFSSNISLNLWENISILTFWIVFLPLFPSMTVYEANIHYKNTLLLRNSKCFKIPSVQNLVIGPLNSDFKILSKLKLWILLNRWGEKHFSYCLAESNPTCYGDKVSQTKIKNIFQPSPIHCSYCQIGL